MVSLVTPTNRVIAGPDLHRAGPLDLQCGDFGNVFLPNVGEYQKKSYDFSVEPLAGTAPYYSRSGLD